MKILLRVEHIKAGQVVDATTETLEGESINIGRGTGAQVRLNSESVAPLHAVLRLNEQGLLIEDLGSGIGTLVNSQRVNSASLSAGDRVQIGSSDLRVFKEGDLWGLAISDKTIHQVMDEQQLVREQMALLDVQQRLPSLLALSLSVAIIVGLVYFFRPVVLPDKFSWSSGPMTSAHKYIEHDCVKCHSEPFQPVKDQDCVACHAVPDHADEIKNIAAHSPLAQKRCAECHMEHNGSSGVHLRDSRQCTACHADLKGLSDKTSVEAVRSLAQHPEFRVEDKGGKRLPLADAALHDETRIKLNHSVHLKDKIRGPNGKVQLQCVDCHALSDDKRLIKPISFEANCRSCHPLEFDSRFPTEQVPHGSEARVRDFLFSQYSELFLRPEEQQKLVAAKRIKPGDIVTAQGYNKAMLEVIYKEVQATEDLLYNKTACQLCHTFEKGNDALKGPPGYSVVKPEIPAVWFTHARFNHKSHLHMKCQDCHTAAEKSADTGDILLPDAASCRECHADPGRIGKIDSDCVMCHAYHQVQTPHAAKP